MYRTRIDLMDTTSEVLYKMSEGNPGALNTLIELMKQSPKIDPLGSMQGLGPLMNLDTNRIYGTDIYILYNDKCERDIRRVLVLLRAVQLGFMTSERLREIAADQTRSVHLTEEEFMEYDRMVCERLPEFMKWEKDNG